MKKVIDGKGRLFGRVSIIDLIVLLVVVVLVAAFFVKFNTGGTTIGARDTVDITYTVRINAIRLSSANLLRVGDNLYAQESGANVGTIAHIEIAEAFAYDTLVDGSYVEARVEDRYDVTLTVSASCTLTNDRYYIYGTTELNANAIYSFYTKYNEFMTVLVISIG